MTVTAPVFGLTVIPVPAVILVTSLLSRLLAGSASRISPIVQAWDTGAGKSDIITSVNRVEKPQAGRVCRKGIGERSIGIIRIDRRFCQCPGQVNRHGTLRVTSLYSW